jgi:hypothetical protein
MMGPVISFWGWGGLGEDFLGTFSLVLNVLPSCCHQVPKGCSDMFLKMFPIALKFYPIQFAQSSTPLYVNYIQGCTFVSISQLGSKEVLPLGGAQCSKKIADRSMNMASKKSHEL